MAICRKCDRDFEAKGRGNKICLTCAMVATMVGASKTRLMFMKRKALGDDEELQTYINE